jgi:hypothetical protein
MQSFLLPPVRRGMESEGPVFTNQQGNLVREAISEMFGTKSYVDTNILTAGYDNMVALVRLGDDAIGGGQLLLKVVAEFDGTDRSVRITLLLVPYPQSAAKAGSHSLADEPTRYSPLVAAETLTTVVARLKQLPGFARREPSHDEMMG